MFFTMPYNIKFIDSPWFVASSLFDLGDNLTERIRNITFNHCDCFLEYESVKDNLIKYKCLSCNKDYSDKLDEKLKMWFNSIQDGIFGGCSRMRGSKSPHSLLPKICHTYSIMMKLGTIILYPKKIQKIFDSCDTPLHFCWHQHFFTRNQQILLYQEIQIYISFWYLISNSVIHFCVFRSWFGKCGYNSDDVSKSGYARLSWNQANLK